MTELEIEDVTGSGLAHAPGEEDRVFRVRASPTPLSADGVYTVKVKSFHDPDATPVGRADVRMTASICDPDGRVLRTSAGAPAVWVQPHIHTIMGDVPDVAGAVEEAMRLVVRNALAAVISAAAVLTVPGVALVSKGTPA